MTDRLVPKITNELSFRVRPTGGWKQEMKMKKVLVLAAAMVLGAAACSSGPSAQQLCMDALNAASVCTTGMMASSSTLAACNNITSDGGTGMSCTSRYNTAVDNCFTAAISGGMSSAACGTLGSGLGTCISNAGQCNQ